MGKGAAKQRTLCQVLGKTSQLASVDTPSVAQCGKVKSFSAEVCPVEGVGYIEFEGGCAGGGVLGAASLSGTDRATAVVMPLR